jgi:tetratricopeptide (TPR) repeat protein
MTAHSLSTADVARVLGVAESRVRRWVRLGWCKPVRAGRGLAFRFQDLVVLRAAKSLAEAQVPSGRISRALGALRRQLGERPLSGLRIAADGRQVTVHDGQSRFEPETGQQLFDFSVDALAEQAASVAPASPSARDEKSGDRALAQRAFSQAVDAEESDPASAIRAYRRALSRDPELVDAWVNLARLVHQTGRAKEAVSLYHEALKRAPEDAETHYNLAIALEDAAGTAAAVAHYERALALDPSLADAHWNLAGLLEAAGRKADALRHYRAYDRLTR